MGRGAGVKRAAAGGGALLAWRFRVARRRLFRQGRLLFLVLTVAVLASTAVTSVPVVNRTLATLRSAELGFLGVVVYTRVQTPRRWGAPRRAGVLDLSDLFSRPVRTSCAMVGKEPLL